MSRRAGRRVFEIAAAIRMKPEDALRALRSLGFGVRVVTDQIPAEKMELALRRLKGFLLSFRPASSFVRDETRADRGVVIESNPGLSTVTDSPSVRREVGTSVASSAKPLPSKQQKASRAVSCHYLNVDEVTNIHVGLVELFARENDPIAPSGVRDVNLLDSAINRPRTSLGTSKEFTEKYTSVLQKAAALFHSLVKNHPFHNGNKRTALVSLLIFLDRNNYILDTTDDELFDFVIGTARPTNTGEGQAAVDQEVLIIQEWIDNHARRVTDNVSEMRASQFIRSVETAGGKSKLKADGTGWIVRGPVKGSVNLPRSRKKLSAGVILKFKQMLGLSLSRSGIHFEEFEEGLDPQQTLMMKFRVVLKRLANA